MKHLQDIITEKLRIGKSIKPYNYYPQTKEELRKILEERLAKDKNANLNDIDVSEITDMGQIGDIDLFERLDPHNIDISEWDVSNVTNMSGMFFHCENFNSDLSGWDVSKVEDMRSTFNGCKNFDSDLNQWDVSNVKDMSWMFNKCSNFKGKGLENWKPKKVKNIKYAFNICKRLTCNLEKWNLNASDVPMDYAFDGCESLKNKPSWYK